MDVLTVFNCALCVDGRSFLLLSVPCVWLGLTFFVLSPCALRLSSLLHHPQHRKRLANDMTGTLLTSTDPKPYDARKKRKRATGVPSNKYVVHVGGTRCVPSSTDNIMKMMLVEL
jgi:hypothetical protein